MVKVGLVVVLQGLQLDVDCLVPAVLITRPCVWPFVRQADGVTVTQGQELLVAAAAATAAACGLRWWFDGRERDARVAVVTLCFLAHAVSVQVPRCCRSRVCQAC